MCELLGMSANTPTDIRFSFMGLMPRGGRTGPHRDGWGIGFFDGPAVRTFLDTGSAADSDIARFLSTYPIKSRNVIAHVRRANRGKVGLANTHPFVREAFGRQWVFAHNGQLKGVKQLPLGRFRPVGTTDSEHAFCWLLGEIERRCGEMPTRRELDGLIARFSGRLAQMGVFNMLLCDSRTLYAHASTRLVWLTRKAPFGVAHLADQDVTADFAAETTPDDVVTIIATHPLTRNEQWAPVPPGSLIAFRDGQPFFVRSAGPLPTELNAPVGRRSPVRAGAADQHTTGVMLV